jgi:long-chain acyl-CoA synthetase
MTSETERREYLSQLMDIAVRQPGSFAVIDENEAITYSELVATVQERAQDLSEAGVQPGDRIALVAENSAQYLISAFAVWSSGGILATIYPSTATVDLAYTLENADPVLVLTDIHKARVVREAAHKDLPVVEIDGPAFDVPALRPGRIANPDLREPLHLICYSSGTTSRPKAIMVSESALANGARTYADVWHLTADDRTIACLPMAWLYGLNTTSMATLIHGGTVIVLRRARPELLIDAIETHHATVLTGVTTMFAKLVSLLEHSEDHHNFPSLRLVVSGGEPRNESVFERFAALTGHPVHDTFCASECFPLITYDPIMDPVPIPGSAGKIVPRSEIRILDSLGNEVRAGEVGEALSRSPGLMLGYWRDTMQSSAAITEDGWYRTKDLVRIDENGYVYVVGRASEMIIRGGSNVSPAEVERVLREHPSVSDVAVIGLPDDTYGQEVVAAIVLGAGAILNPSELRTHSAQHLASFKVPSRYVAFTELPQNATTGKLDRRQVAAKINLEETA